MGRGRRTLLQSPFIRLQSQLILACQESIHTCGNTTLPEASQHRDCRWLCTVVGFSSTCLHAKRNFESSRPCACESKANFASSLIRTLCHFPAIGLKRKLRQISRLCRCKFENFLAPLLEMPEYRAGSVFHFQLNG